MFSDDFFELPKANRISHLWDVTNFIDVVIILLIFYVSTSVLNKTGIPLQQSRAKAVVRTLGTTMTLDIAKNGDVYFEKRLIPHEEIRPLIVAKHEADPDLVVVLNADRDASTQALISTLDLCKSAGVDKFSFAATAP